MAGAVLHMQQQRLATGWFVGLIATCVALLGVALVPDLPSLARTIMLVVGGVMLLVLIEFERLTVILTAEELLVGFRLLKTKTRIRDIEDAHKTEVRFFRHGLGLHFYFPIGWAMTVRTGPGIEMFRRDRLPFTFSCTDPDALLLALSKAGGRANLEENS